ncbi:EF-hand domain-containing protein [Salipiger sp. 1_MG-2023]|uniref:EF-hand domain-containing protein n=1 Tax=Salipiger sp. 1_MG-2023 TaxID=3062665 RepID=UPI0026E375EC|nr:EF-hand domain-containing protein [Salipiger sp. 1_MG-2023]MDO6588271.1 EF-hand domain-containing protein [Salipiger sp. 1_MG-2023]
MTRKAKLLIGAALTVIGTSGFVIAAPGDQQQGRGPRAGGAPMMVEMFKSLDADGDGTITQDELAAAGPAGAFAEADANGDGALEADELTAFRQAQEAAREARRQQQMLQRFDADKDGKLSLEELTAGDRRGPERLFTRLDVDEDGTVSAEELAALEQMQPRMRGEGKGGERMGHGEHGKHHGDKGDREARMHDEHGPRGEHGPRDMNRPPMPEGDAPMPPQPAE